MRLRNNRRKKQPKPSVIRPWSGVRNAVIAVLLAVNVVLLLALGCVKGYDAVLKHQMHKQMDSMRTAGRAVRIQCVPDDGTRAAGVYAAGGRTRAEAVGADAAARRHQDPSKGQRSGLER